MGISLFKHPEYPYFMALFGGLNVPNQSLTRYLNVCMMQKDKISKPQDPKPQEIKIWES